MRAAPAVVYLIPKQFKIKNVRPDICLAERVSRYRCTGRFLSLSTQWSCTESLRTQWRCWPLTLGRHERCSKTLEPYERRSWYFGRSMLYISNEPGTEQPRGRRPLYVLQRPPSALHLRSGPKKALPGRVQMDGLAGQDHGRKQPDRFARRVARTSKSAEAANSGVDT